VEECKPVAPECQQATSVATRFEIQRRQTHRPQSAIADITLSASSARQATSALSLTETDHVATVCRQAYITYDVQVESGLTSHQTLQILSGTGFYGSNNPTNCVRALNEDRFLKIMVCCDPTMSTPTVLQ